MIFGNQPIVIAKRGISILLVLLSFIFLSNYFWDSVPGFPSYSNWNSNNQVVLLGGKVAVHPCKDRVLEPGMTKLNVDGGKVWMPAGHCPFRNFTQNTKYLESCVAFLKGQKQGSRVQLMFIGDSRIRQLHKRTVRMFTFLDPKLAVHGINPWQSCDAHVNKSTGLWGSEQCDLNVVFPDKQIEITRKWMAYVNYSMTGALLEKLAQSPLSDLPRVIVINSGSWRMRDCWLQQVPAENCTSLYASETAQLVNLLGRISRRIPVIWVPQSFLNASILRWGNSDPRVNLYVENFNAIAENLLRETSVYIWSSYEQIFAYRNESPDGIHLSHFTKHLAH